jgi:hypothetical protein
MRQDGSANRYSQDSCLKEPTGIDYSARARTHDRIPESSITEAIAKVVGLVTAQKLDTAATYVVESIHALTYLVTASTVATETLMEYR